MRELHLFAGAGGGILGGMLLGHTCVCAVEIEPYCRKVLLQRQRDGILPRFPIWDDVRTFDGKPWRGKVDVVCGGFPCKGISPAGRGEGFDHAETGLWSEMARVVCEMGPKFVLVENSPLLTVRGLGIVLRDLATMGYNVPWGVFSAANTNAPQCRQRMWLLAHSDSQGLEGIHETRWGKYLQPTSGTLRRNWSPEPQLDRVANGMAYRVDRLKAIGNGQVPAVVRLAWNTLLGSQ